MCCYSYMAKIDAEHMLCQTLLLQAASSCGGPAQRKTCTHRLCDHDSSADSANLISSAFVSKFHKHRALEVFALEMPPHPYTIHLYDHKAIVCTAHGTFGLDSACNSAGRKREAGLFSSCAGASYFSVAYAGLHAVPGHSC